MNKNMNKFSLTRKIFLTMISSVTLMIILLSGFEIIHSYRNYRQEINLLKNKSVSNQKNMIKMEVNKAIFYLNGLIEFNQQLPQNEQMPLPELKNYIISKLSELRYRSDGYFFASARNGEPLFSNGKITRNTGNVWEITDPNGVKIIQKQHEAFDLPNGVFTKYSWQKLNQLKLSSKISFTKKVPELDWIIGTGVYLEDINNQIEYTKKTLKNELIFNNLHYLLFLFAYFLIYWYIIRHFSANIQKNIESFSQFFLNSSDNYQNIDLQNLHYLEFKKIALAANNMINNRKISEEALHISEDKYRLLINTTSEGFWMLDAEMNTVEVNDSLCKMLKFSKNEFIGKKPLDFLNSQNSQTFREHFLQSLETKHQSYELSINTKSGISLPCFINSTKLIDENDICYATFAFITDITNRKNYEKKLNDYQNHLEDLIKDRTSDLETKNKELNRYNKLFVGREFRIKELRDQVKNLENKLKSSQK